MFVQYIFKKLNIVLIILKIDEDQDLDYDVVRITNIGFVDPYGNEGLIVLRDDDNKEFHMRAFSGEVSRHIASFIDLKAAEVEKLKGRLKETESSSKADQKLQVGRLSNAVKLESEKLRLATEAEKRSRTQGMKRNSKQGDK